jgi:hypothetical protein
MFYSKTGFKEETTILNLSTRLICQAITTHFNTANKVFSTKKWCFFIKGYFVIIPGPCLKLNTTVYLNYQTRHFHQITPKFYIYFILIENSDSVIVYFPRQNLFSCQRILTMCIPLGSETAQSVQELCYRLDCWGIEFVFFDGTRHFPPLGVSPDRLWGAPSLLHSG